LTFCLVNLVFNVFKNSFFIFHCSIKFPFLLFQNSWIEEFPIKSYLPINHREFSLRGIRTLSFLNVRFKLLIKIFYSLLNNLFIMSNSFLSLSYFIMDNIMYLGSLNTHSLHNTLSFFHQISRMIDLNGISLLFHVVSFQGQFFIKFYHLFYFLM